jgi:CheY-like chemotaxis protein
MIMVIDDEPDLLAITRIMLEREGYNLHTFTNPIAALSHVEDGCCMDRKLVLSDVRMPSMSGFELVRHVKDLRREIKVILMTAFEINKEEAQNVLPLTLVEAFLNKPFRSVDLIEAVKKASSSSLPS